MHSGPTQRKPGIFDHIVASILLLFFLYVTLDRFFFVLAALAAFGVLLYFRAPILHAFNSSQSGPDTILARRLLILASSVSSFAALLTLPSSEDSALHAFFGGAFALPALYLAGIELKSVPKTFWTRFFLALFDGLTELALILTVVGGLYAAATLYLRHTIVNSGTLAELRRLDFNLLYARVFLSKLKFSAWQTIAIAALLLLLQQLERRWLGQQASAVEKTWHAFRTTTKWMSRLALAALFAASFTLLATQSNDIAGKVGARIRDFEESYNQLRGATEKAFDAQLKRELLNHAWQKLPQSERDAIRQAIANRAESLRLRGEFDELQRSFAAKNDAIEDALSRDRAIVEPDFSAVVVVPNPEPSPGVPPSAENLSLEAIQRLSAEATEYAKTIASAPPPEPVKSMKDVITSKLLDIGFDRLKEQFKFFDELDSHFPGLGELFDAAWGAGSDTFLEQRKEAKQKALEKKLKSPELPLREIVPQQVQDLARSAMPPAPSNIQTIGHQQQAFARATQLREAKLLLLQDAHSIESAALQASEARAGEMRSQLKLLIAIDKGPLGFQVALPPELFDSPVHVDTGSKNASSDPPKSEFPAPHAPPLHRGASNQKPIVAFPPDPSATPHETLQNSGPPPDPPAHPIIPPALRYRFSNYEPTDRSSSSFLFSDKRLFPDQALTAQLRKSFDAEQKLEDAIIVIVGRNKSSRTAELHDILGENFTKYARIADRRAIEASGSLHSTPGSGPDLPDVRIDPITGRPRNPGELPGERRGQPERPRPVEAPHPVFHPIP